ncbi:hypothetical protein [Pseudomonas sp. DTU12.3]|nr:hypothetical protein [Pseudomonas sp. DTU12.3]
MNHPELTLPGVPQENFQVLSFGAELPAGEVKYHDAFVASE